MSSYSFSIFVFFSLSLSLSLSLPLLIPSVFSSSNGNLNWCDLGTDPSVQVGTGTAAMYWAATASLSSSYTIRSGDGPDNSTDPTYYTPGVPNAIHIRSLDPNNKYLGIVLYAIPSSGGPFAFEASVRLGTWTVSSADPFQTLFSGQCVTHAGANLKPMHNIFWWTAPIGSGSVTFRMMVKVGEQNTGWFYYPSVPLVLLEGRAPTPQSAVQYSAPGETCSTFCSHSTTIPAIPYCDYHETLALNNITRLRSIVPPAGQSGTHCPLPILSSCSIAAPFIDADGYCVLQDSTCGSPATDPCEAFNANSARVCACSASPVLFVPPAAAANGQGGAAGQSSFSLSTEDIIAIVVACVAAFIIFPALFFYFRFRKFHRNVQKKNKHFGNEISSSPNSGKMNSMLSLSTSTASSQVFVQVEGDQQEEHTRMDRSMAPPKAVKF